VPTKEPMKTRPSVVVMRSVWRRRAFRRWSAGEDECDGCGEDAMCDGYMTIRVDTSQIPSYAGIISRSL